MIRINLASTKTLSAAMGGATFAETAAVVSNDKSRRDGLTRLLVIILFPTALFLYQQQNVPALVAELGRKQAALNELNTFNGKAENSVKEIKKFKEDELKIQARIAVLEKISKDRFREVKVLDLFQQIIPEKLWLTGLEVKDGRVLLTGLSISDIDISTFMDSLSKSVFLQDVVLISSSEQLQDDMTLKKFEISCFLDRTGNHL
jgi:type IV pilus assembly protein PilN